MSRFSTAIAIIALALFVSGQAQAENASAGDAIRAVISGQIAAFKRDDAAGAYAYAAPNVREMFPTADVFMAMVKTGYRQVYRPRSYVFGELGTRDGQVIQAVRIIGPEGGAVIAHYIMEQQPDGAWKIAGVFLTKSPDLAA